MAQVKLFKRKLSITIDTIKVTNLAAVFHVEKSLKPEPNKADVTIFNLNKDHRKALEQLKAATVLIEAGYEEGTSTLFLGDLRTGVSAHNGTEYETKASAGDGEKKIKTARVKISLKKGHATPDKVLKQVAKSLGVGEGNLKDALRKIQGAGITNHFSEGYVATGSAFKEMNRICKSVGLTWSIQDGKLQILELKTALAGSAVRISEATGMVGAPTVDNDGVLNCKTLLIPDVFPGRLMVIDAQDIKGNYRIESCKYSGATHETDWYIDIEAKRY